MIKEGIRLVGPANYTRQLLLRREKATVALPLKRVESPEGAPRMRWIGDALRKDALGWVCREGGWRRLQVVVGGRRREGRVWDAKIFSQLKVRFSPAPIDLLVASMKTQEALPRLTDELRAALRASLTGDDPATGDILAVHRLITCLASGDRRGRAGRRGKSGAGDQPLCPFCQEPLDVEPRKRRGRGRAKRTLKKCPHCASTLKPGDLEAPKQERKDLFPDYLPLSPLTLVFQPERAGQLNSGLKSDRAVAALVKYLAPLFRGDRPALLSYLDEAISRSWLEEEKRRRALAPAEAQRSYAATVRGLTAYVRAASERPDALRPLIGYFEGYVIRKFGARAPVVEALRQQASSLNRASEREEFLRGASQLFALGRHVTQVVERALSTAFVDRTEAEKVILAEYHERFRNVGPEVEAIRRELAGEIG